ncbi:DNA-directed RNA polymerase subunit omega [Streptococcus parauberis]|nr:DNA-directed RNA polymerase subunit omega [Streptococcus parauberis]
MMLKPSIDTLLDKVPSKYSLVILQAKRAHELEAGANPTQGFKSVKSTQALEEIESGNVVIHPDPSAKRAAVRAKIEAERIAKEEEERKIKEQIAKEKEEEGEKI